MSQNVPPPFPPRDMRSSLGRARGLGSAHDGTSHWIWQRLTAIALLPLSLWFVYGLLKIVTVGDHAAVLLWMSSPVTALLLALMLVALFWHAKLGMQVVIEDYVHGSFWKYALLIGNALAFFALGAMSLFAVARLHFAPVMLTAIG